jgi:hypothetical protein
MVVLKGEERDMRGRRGGGGGRRRGSKLVLTWPRSTTWGSSNVMSITMEA